MNFSDYQEHSRSTALYPGKDTPIGLMYAGLGLGGEGGEVLDHIKKIWRSGGELTNERIDGIKDELGDVLWYVAQIATEAGLDLEDVAIQNNAKLAQRAETNQLKEHA